MKKTILIISILLAGGFCSMLPQKVYSTSVNTKHVYGIKDGWYSARVLFHSGGAFDSYTLKVYVQNDSVTIIDFGIRGTVHAGHNNEGYYYRGGSLYFEPDRNGNIIAATSTVAIGTNRTIYYYEIRIEQ
jgi:hypothetical protein